MPSARADFPLVIKDDKCPHGRNIFESGRCEYCDRDFASWKKIMDALDTIYAELNIMGDQVGLKAVASGVANEHPTLSGQFAKAVAIGIVQRAERDPEWKPFQKFGRICHLNDALPEHPDHDGRHSCDLVAGAVLAAHQYFV